MKGPVAFFTIALAVAAIILAPRAAARADTREEGPTEIEKCQTIDKPGSYKLVRNLTAANGSDCLDITAIFVTINLDGFTITGLGATAISGGEFDNIAVRNGSISGFGNGVILGSESIVEALRVRGEGPGGGAGIRAAGIVRGNIVEQVGAGPGGAGVGISAAGIVTGNFAGSNGRGMEIGQGSTVIGNTVSGNRVSGISVDCPSNVTDNTAVDTGLGPNLTLNGNGCNNTNNVAP